MNLLGWLLPRPLPPVPTTDDPPSVRRARSVVGQGRYWLGAGGKRGDAASPFDAEGRSDCSGFVSWCLGLDRHQPWGYVWTNGIVADARGPQRHFARVDVGAEVRAGDLVVYGGGERGGPRIGHVGIVASVPAGWRYESAASLAALRIIHCASSGRVAVRESDGGPWRRRGMVARLK